MHNNNLLKLLKSFTAVEFRDFTMFVDSQYFNREKALMKLSGIITNYYPEFTDPALQKEKVFSLIFPRKRYNDALMRNTVSDFLKLAEEYLKIVQLKKDPFHEQYLLLKELTNRKQQKLFKMNFKKADKILKETGIVDEIYYQNNFLLEDEFRRNVVVNSSKILFKDDNMDKQAYNHNLHFLVENIKLYAIMLNQNKFTFDHNYDFTFFEILREYIEKNFHLYKDVLYINIFYNCVMLYKTSKKEYFDNLKHLIKKHYFKLTLTDRKNMYTVLTNHCNTRIRVGQSEYYSELFEIYLDMLSKRAYLEGNDFMAHYIYNSIALNAIFGGKVDWAEKFVNKYKSMLHSDFRMSSYYFCMASINLERGKYNDALENLSNVKPLDVIFKIYINRTLLKIYFCKNESESFFSLVDSFRHFLKRNTEVRSEDKILYNNFIYFIRQIFIFKSKPGKKDISELMVLKDKLFKNDQTSFRKWLLEKIDETEYLS